MHHCGRLLRRRERRPERSIPDMVEKKDFFSNRRTGGKRVYRDIYRSSGKFHAIESDRQAVSLDDYAEDGMKQLVKYMYAHLEEFQILVKSSYGTRFQDFVEHLVELETDYTYKFMEAIGLRFKDGKPLTKNFMHIMNKALFESFFEVIRHDMSEEEAWEYIEMLEKYHSAGWNIIYGECCSIND